MNLINNSINFIADKFFQIIRRNSKGAYGERIIIICLHKLGDSVFTIEAVKKIKIIHGNNVTLICFNSTIEIYRQIFGNDIEYVTISQDDFILNNRIAKHRARSFLKYLNPLLIYDLTGAINSASLIFNSKAKEIIGTNSRIYRNIYDYYSEIRKTPHISYIYIDALKSKYKDLTYDRVDKFKVEINHQGAILIHPYAGWTAKEWGLDKFLILAEKLSKEHKIEFILPPGKTNEIPLEFLHKFKCIETLTTTELISKISECKLLIGNDSGAVNIANLMGKPVFIIYGPSNPSFHLPLNGIAGFIQKKVHCSPISEKLCFTNGGREGCPKFICMEQLSVDEVYNSFYNFYKQNILIKKDIHAGN